MQCAGPAASALPAIERLDLPDSARQLCHNLRSVVHILSRSNADWDITVDVTENRGLSYHSGIHFSIFIPGASAEVGRGGRYLIGQDMQATGFTLYVETLRQLLAEPVRKPRLFVPESLDAQAAAKLHAQGFVTVHALPGFGNGADEAQRLGCSHWLKDGAITAL